MVVPLGTIAEHTEKHDEHIGGYSFEVVQVFLQRFACATLDGLKLRLRLATVFRTFVIIILVRLPI